MEGVISKHDAYSDSSGIFTNYMKLEQGGEERNGACMASQRDNAEDFEKRLISG